jgi:hypothetical protein
MRQRLLSDPHEVHFSRLRLQNAKKIALSLIQVNVKTVGHSNIKVDYASAVSTASYYIYKYGRGMLVKISIKPEGTA